MASTDYSSTAWLTPGDGASCAYASLNAVPPVNSATGSASLGPATLTGSAACAAYCTPFNYFHNQNDGGGQMSNCMQGGDTAWMVRAAAATRVRGARRPALAQDGDAGAGGEAQP